MSYTQLRFQATWYDNELFDCDHIYDNRSPHNDIFFVRHWNELIAFGCNKHYRKFHANITNKSRKEEYHPADYQDVRIEYTHEGRGERLPY